MKQKKVIFLMILSLFFTIPFQRKEYINNATPLDSVGCHGGSQAPEKKPRKRSGTSQREPRRGGQVLGAALFLLNLAAGGLGSGGVLGHTVSSQAGSISSFQCVGRSVER